MLIISVLDLITFSFLSFLVFLLEKVKQLVKKICQSCLHKEHWKIHLGEIRRKSLDFANVALLFIAFRGRLSEFASPSRQLSIQQLRQTKLNLGILGFQ